MFRFFKLLQGDSKSMMLSEPQPGMSDSSSAATILSISLYWELQSRAEKERFTSNIKIVVDLLIHNNNMISKMTMSNLKN